MNKKKGKKSRKTTHDKNNNQYPELKTSVNTNPNINKQSANPWDAFDPNNPSANVGVSDSMEQPLVFENEESK